MQVIGETDPADLSADSDDDESSDVPVRLLTDFTIYDLKTLQLVPVAELLHIQYGGSTVYAASGTVKPYVENDDDDEDEDEVVDEEEVEESLHQDEGDVQVIKLLKIVEFDIHSVSSRKKKLDRYVLLLIVHNPINNVIAVKCTYEPTTPGTFLTCLRRNTPLSSQASGFSTASYTSLSLPRWATHELHSTRLSRL